MSKSVFITFFITILLGNILLAYQPHFENPFPLVGDEYVHIAFGEYIEMERKLPIINPYFLTLHEHTNFESGFHFLLAGIFAVVPGEPVLFYKYLVVAFSIINSVLIFWLVRKLAKDNLAGLMTMFFFGTIKSSGGILSHQYFVPFTLGITLLLLLFILFNYFLEKRSRTVTTLLLITLFLTAISYPPALFFFLGVALIYLFSPNHTLHEEFNLTRQKFLGLLGLSTIFVISVFVLALYELGVLNTAVFSSSWEVIQTRHSLLFFFGVIPSALAGIGLLKIWLTEDPWPNVFVHWFWFSLAALYGFHLFGASILLPYPRLFVFYLIGVSVLAGIGLAYGSRLLYQAIKIRYWGTLIIVAVVSLSATHYFSVWKQPLAHHPTLTPESFAALTFLASIPEENAVVIADSVTSFAVYPVAHKHVVNLLSSNVGGGDVRAAQTFLNGSCKERLSVIAKFYTIPQQSSDGYPPLYLLTDKATTCDFLKPIYETGPYIYQIEL